MNGCAKFFLNTVDRYCFIFSSGMQLLSYNDSALIYRRIYRFSPNAVLSPQPERCPVSGHPCSAGGIFDRVQVSDSEVCRHLIPDSSFTMNQMSEFQQGIFSFYGDVTG